VLSDFATRFLLPPERYALNRHDRGGTLKKSCMVTNLLREISCYQELKVQSTFGSVFCFEVRASSEAKKGVERWIHSEDDVSSIAS
jgi:hypothetical protein